MDPGYWEELAAMAPPSVCRRSGAVLEEGGYRLRVFSSDYHVVPGRQKITVFGNPGEGASGGLEMLVVHYLINARDIPLADDWIRPQEFGGANRFFVSHAPNFSRLLPLFESSPEAIVQGAQMLGGRRLDYGDVSVELRMLPRVPIAFVYWAGCDEFPAEASVMFDRTAGQHLPLDVVSAAIHEAIGRLAAAAQEPERPAGQA